MDDDVVKSEDSLLAERALKKMIEIHEKCEIMKLQWCEREDVRCTASAGSLQIKHSILVFEIEKLKNKKEKF